MYKYNKEKQRQANNKKVIDNPNYYKEKYQKYKDYNKDYYWKNAKRYRIYAYKRGAKRRNLIWDLSDMQIDEIITKPCYYCGEMENIGIDRVDNKIGYIVSNCVPCCYPCNLMKSDFTKEFFIKHCKKIIEFNN